MQMREAVTLLEDNKKVEYLELIYDLIFVYLIGRSNALLYSTPGGFFTLQSFVTYLISSLIILQVWATSTFYINRYGKNNTGDHIILFFNMYLLYYMGKGIRSNWGREFASYHGAWGLILGNILVQYGRHLLAAEDDKERQYLKGQIAVLVLEVMTIFALIGVYACTGMAFSWIPLAIWALGALCTQKGDDGYPVNFEHLTERVMLYVVFSFGLMSTSIVDYFEGEISAQTVYFSLMAFLVTAGLFLSYGFMYNHVLDRTCRTTGKLFLSLHIGLILSLSNLTVALEFMRRDWLDSVLKNILLISSFVVYYVFLFAIGWLSRRDKEDHDGFLYRAGLISCIFVAASAACYQVGWASILFSAAYIYAMFALMAHRFYSNEKMNRDQGWKV